ncbi:SRPBCC family protein [Undibacterium terreum]|uniref:Polyketide cyclase n=1 Tax=Undibacterium terreum TaxID=1224302 RepID=A0A916XGD9_9BURK|nr:SRPBCC family protein [Undibacterium terreum]GGC70140.1 polyketide cyclase [Undibacterium terreum]
MSESLRHLNISIMRTAQAVYDYASMPQNFSHWASGLGNGLKQHGDAWTANTDNGQVTIRFSTRNTYGVLDHWVSLPTGQKVYIPLRVIANGEHSELVFTLLRQPDIDDAKFAADAAWVTRDLQRLKDILESA